MPSHYEHQQLQRKRKKKIREESLKKQNKISAQLRCQQINDTIKKFTKADIFAILSTAGEQSMIECVKANEYTTTTTMIEKQ